MPSYWDGWQFWLWILSWLPFQVLQGAHDFVINIGISQETDEKPNALRELKERSIPGAEFNSAERDKPPRCHPGTRTSIREEIHARLENTTLGTRVIWINGTAGIGKSAIMQTVVEEVSSNLICATVFFSRPNHRDDPHKVFTTLAYRLAVANPDYCQHIGTVLKTDPMCLRQTLDDQFKTLFITPFLGDQKVATSRRWVMFLDGLDECQNTEDSDNQCRVLNLICDSILDHAELTPFVWVIASRPEVNLKRTWLRIQDRFQGRAPDLWELVVPADSDQATQDVELYLHKEFERIRSDYSDFMPRKPWPSEGDFTKVAEKSSGLFVFADTVVKYVSHEDPVYRLKHIVSLIDRAEKVSTLRNEKPFHKLDLLYSSIMSDVPERLLFAVKSLIGFYHLMAMVVVQRPDQTGLGLVEACNILGLRQNDAYASLRKLQSVIICPSPEEAEVKNIKFHHASFSDFLLDPSRSGKYSINLDQEFKSIWRRYVEIIKESTAKQDHAGVNISWLPNDETSLLDQFQRQLLQTAQITWANLVVTSLFVPETRNPQVDVPLLIEIFRVLHPVSPKGNVLMIEDFLNRFDEDILTTIRGVIVSEMLALSKLNTDRLFKSLCTKPQYWLITDSTLMGVDFVVPKCVASSQWDYARETALWSTSGVFGPQAAGADIEDTGVMVFGIDPSEVYALVESIDDRGHFYIFPYHAK